MTQALALLKTLIQKPSITPHDAGCQVLLAEMLKQEGFTIVSLPFGEVHNLWAFHGNAAPVFAFVGHTDVVPTGPLEQWISPPFEPTVREGYLYGRGAADMKSGVSAMTCAAIRFVQANPHHAGTLALLLTSDEEGVAENGIKKVVEYFKQQKQPIDYAMIAEPSSHQTLGDTIKIGRRGTLSGKAIIRGKQGHIAYADRADNPIHRAMPGLQALITQVWDKGNAHFQPTAFQISNIHAGTGANNVIPGEMVVEFNFRYSPEIQAETLMQSVETVFKQHELHYKLEWQHGGRPFYTPQGNLLDAVQETLIEFTGKRAQESTHGGTSDGRFIIELGAEVVELGPINHTIHQINECVSIADLEVLTQLYQRILEKVLSV